MRTCVEQAGDLMKQMALEAELDSRLVKPEDEIAARLARLRDEDPNKLKHTEKVISYLIFLNVFIIFTYITIGVFTKNFLYFTDFVFLYSNNLLSQLLYMLLFLVFMYIYFAHECQFYHAFYWQRIIKPYHFFFQDPCQLFISNGIIEICIPL